VKEIISDMESDRFSNRIEGNNTKEKIKNGEVNEKW